MSSPKRLPILPDILSDERARKSILSRMEKLLAERYNYKHEEVCVMSYVSSTSMLDPVKAAFSSMSKDHVDMIGNIIYHLYTNHGCRKLFMVLHSPGGDVVVPEIIEKKVRGIGFEFFGTIIPSEAWSAGTLLALLSDKIIAIKGAIIGPIDPQLVIPKRGVVPARRIRDLVETHLRNLARLYGIDPNNLVNIIGMFAELYSAAKDALEYVHTEMLLNKVKGKVKDFNRLYKTLLETPLHSRPISINELQDMGFPVDIIDINSDLGKEIWHYYIYILKELQLPGSDTTVIVETKDTTAKTGVQIIHLRPLGKDGKGEGSNPFIPG